VAIAVGTAVAIGLIGGHSLPDYDATYALIWGRDIAHAHAPDYSLPYRPAGHPLTTLVGIIGTPLGRDGAAELLRWVSLLGAGAFVAATFRFGQALFGALAGAIAALLLATRSPLWGFSELMFMDAWAAAFVVWAAVLEYRTPRRGPAVFVLLALAGLLRPEVWLFALAYWAWIALGSRQRALRLTPLALLAPIVWAVFDLVTVQQFLGSVKTDAGLPTPVSTGGHGIGHAPSSLVRFVGGFARVPEVVAAVVGAALLLRSDWKRAALPAALVALNLLTFALVAVRSGPLEQRYLLVAASMVLVFAGYAIAQLVDAATLPQPGRRVARIAATVLALACLAYVPIDVRRLDDLHDQVATSNSVYSELSDLVRTRRARCLLRSGAHVPDLRLRPVVAYWGEVAPARVDTEPGPGAVVIPLTPVAQELSSRSLPADPDTSPGAPPRWRVAGVCAQY
jgi:hypothetical protein